MDWKMTFFTELNLDTDRWVLMCSEHGFTAPCGPRLFRAPPHPDIRFIHETEEAAMRDLDTLRKYWEGLPQQRKKKSTARGAFSE